MSIPVETLPKLPEVKESIVIHNFTLIQREITFFSCYSCLVLSFFPYVIVPGPKKDKRKREDDFADLGDGSSGPWATEKQEAIITVSATPVGEEKAIAGVEATKQEEGEGKGKGRERRMRRRRRIAWCISWSQMKRRRCGRR